MPKIEQEHAVLHTIWGRLQQGFKQGDWTLDKVRSAHDEAAKKLTATGILHESPIETGRPDKSSHTRHDIEVMSDDVLQHTHANMHSLYSKMSQGEVRTGWTFNQLLQEHDDIAEQLVARGFEHDSPME